MQKEKEGLRDLLEGCFIEPGLWNKLYHRRLMGYLTEQYDRSRQIRINEDLLMNYYLFKASHRSVYEDFCPYHYMVRYSSATRSGFQAYKVLDPVRVWSTILKDTDSELKDIVWGKYLSACRNAYEVFQGNKSYEQRSKDLRKVLLRHRDKWYLLNKTGQLRMYFLLTAPTVYKSLNHFYEKHLRKTIYE